MSDAGTQYFLELTPDSPLLVGGWSQDATADGVTAHRQDQHQRADCFVTGSALRGAMRIAFEQVLRGAGQTACAPTARPGAGASCTCRVCSLFGNVGQEGLLQVGPAFRDQGRQGGRLQLHLRHGVAIDRHTGSAADQRLFQHRVAAPVGEVVLRAAISFSRPPKPAEIDDLRLAASLVEGLGSGAARGLGHVRLELREERMPASACAGSVPDKATGLAVILEAVTPFHVGTGRSRPFFLPSLSHVPGSALRGAVGTSLAALGLEHEPGFRMLCGLDGHRGASFGDATPWMNGRPAIRPRSLLRCRNSRCDATSGSQLARALAAIELGSATASEVFAKPSRCEKCGERTQPVDAFDAPARRLWTRVALDRHTASAADQQLHAMEVVEAGAEPLLLRAEVHGLDTQSLAILKRLQGRHVAVGHGRGVGLGRMRLCLELIPATGEALLRWQMLQQSVARQRPGHREPAQNWVVLLATGPWTRDCGGEHPLHDRAGHELVRCYPVRGVVSGFDLQAGRERMRRHAWLPGTVFVYRCAAPPSAESLQRLQEQGALGCGPSAVRGEGRFEVNPEVCWNWKES
jgi:CRISPR/Cas system CSM-associated protein Csm3 (group 7 of RAMP superfamily)